MPDTLERENPSPRSNNADVYVYPDKKGPSNLELVQAYILLPTDATDSCTSRPARRAQTKPTTKLGFLIGSSTYKVIILIWLTAVALGWTTSVNCS